MVGIEKIIAYSLAFLFIISACFIQSNSSQIPANQFGTRANVTNSTIYVGNYTFDCLVAEPDIPLNLTSPEPIDGVMGEYIVHCIGPTLPGWLSNISAQGGQIVGKMKYYAFHVRMTPEQAENIENLSYVDWVGSYHPAYKLSTDIDGLDVQVILYGTPVPESEIEEIRSQFDSIFNERATLSFNNTEDGYLIEGTLTSTNSINEIAANVYTSHISKYYDFTPLGGDDTLERNNYLIIVALASLILIITAVFYFRKK